MPSSTSTLAFGDRAFVYASGRRQGRMNLRSLGQTQRIGLDHELVCALPSAAH